MGKLDLLGRNRGGAGIVSLYSLSRFFMSIFATTFVALRSDYALALDGRELGRSESTSCLSALGKDYPENYPIEYKITSSSQPGRLWTIKYNECDLEAFMVSPVITLYRCDYASFVCVQTAWALPVLVPRRPSLGNRDVDISLRKWGVRFQSIGKDGECQRYRAYPLEGNGKLKYQEYRYCKGVGVNEIVTYDKSGKVAARAELNSPQGLFSGLAGD